MTDLTEGEMARIRASRIETDTPYDLADIDDLGILAESAPGEREALEAEARAALASGHVTVGDAIAGWQRGWIDDARALELTSAADVYELRRLAQSSAGSGRSVPQS
jgi:hypothetical protein